MRRLVQNNASYVLKLAAVGLLILLLLSPALIWGIEGDITGDDAVNWDDVNSLCERWLFENCSEANWCSGADIDESNSVDFKDFAVIVSNWLPPLIVEDLFTNSNSLANWTIVDEGSLYAPSNWSIVSGELAESSNILGPYWGAEDNRKGTYAYWKEPNSLFWADYKFNVSLRSSDNGGIGVIFRYRDADNYYKFDMDSRKTFRKLFKVHNGVETTVASSSVGYTPSQQMELSVDVVGDEFNILLDGFNVFGGAVTDSNISCGTLALYNWGNQTSYFDDFWVHIKRIKSTIANHDNYQVFKDTTLEVTANGVLSNDIATIGSLTADVITEPEHGDLTLNTDGTFTYTPDTNHVGWDNFVYEASNNYDADEAIVTIRVRSETEFSIVLLPDTQDYSTYYPAIYNIQTQWIIDNKDELNIAFVLHEGDVTNYNAPYEWDNADDAMSILDGNVPYAIAVGNHDTGCNGSSNTRDNSLFNQYFPASRFDNLVGTFEPNHMENSYHYFTAGGIDWLIFALEFGPRNEVLDWANTVVTSHPNRRVMVVTHNYMYSDDTRVGIGDLWNPHYYGLCTGVSDPNEVCNDGEEMWENFVKLHENISFVFSGHIVNDGVGTLVSTGDYGNSVYQMLANYQFLENGGNGWLRILTFYPEHQKVTVETYSPYLDRYNKASDQQFEFLNVNLTTP